MSDSHAPITRIVNNPQTRITHTLLITLKAHIQSKSISQWYFTDFIYTHSVLPKGDSKWLTTSPLLHFILSIPYKETYVTSSRLLSKFPWQSGDMNLGVSQIQIRHPNHYTILDLTCFLCRRSLLQSLAYKGSSVAWFGNETGQRS